MSGDGNVDRKQRDFGKGVEVKMLNKTGGLDQGGRNGRMPHDWP